jgi:hypothetical protein
MMKKSLFAILCLFLSSTLWAAEPVQLSRINPMGVGKTDHQLARAFTVMAGGGAAAAGVTCATGTIDATHTSTTTSAQLGVNFAGQSFQVTNNGSHIYSIVLRMLGGPGVFDLTLKYGDGINLDTNTLGTVVKNDVSISDVGTVVEFVIQDTTNTFNSGTTYYFAVSGVADSGTALWYLSSTSGYANGTGYWTGDAGKWDLNGHDDTGDFSFDVKVCD